MKRLFSIITLLCYLFSISSLVHASTMGFFGDHTTTKQVHSCHGNNNSNTKDTQNKKTNLYCCELVFSNNISQCTLKFKDIVKSLSAFSFVNHFSHTFQPYNFITLQTSIKSPPGGHLSIKYNKFSDLVGIIVKVI